MWGLATIWQREDFQSTLFLDNLPCGCLNNSITQLNDDMPTIGFFSIRSDLGLPKFLNPS